MTRYRAFSRRELRSSFRAWAWRQRTQLALIAILAVSLLVLAWLVLSPMRSAHQATGGYLLGVLQTVVVMSFGFAVYVAFVAHDRTAILHVPGAWGEENTRDMLKRARRKRLIWGWVDSVTLENGDIDHLVVTRSGGLVAIDSKWRNHIGPDDREDMAAAAAKCRLRAEGIVQTLHKHERGSHRARTKPTRVAPLVVVWGSAHATIPEGAAVNDVEFIGGHRLIRWLRERNGDVVDKAAAHELLTGLEAFREQAWAAKERTLHS